MTARRTHNPNGVATTPVGGKRVCSVCDTEKDISDFYQRIDGNYSHDCKPCHKQRTREWREQNREWFREIQARWYQRNREKANQRTRQWRSQNKDRARETQRRWNARHREQLEEIRREWHAKNPHKAAEYSRRQREKIRAEKMLWVETAKVWEGGLPNVGMPKRVR